jgi:1-pyrroline-5-carboxylate dehydrogenase
MADLFEPYKNEPYSDFTQPGPLETYRKALKRVRQQLGQDYPLVIGEERLTTGAWLASRNPSNPEEIVGRTAMGKAEHIEQAMRAAWEAYASWSRLPMAHRARTLVKLAAIMRRRKFDLCAWMTLEASKNYAESEADVAEAIDFVEYYARQALALDGPLETHHYPGEENTSFLLPIGVGVIIPPWNFPFAILVGMTIGPVVVGNTAIVKPSPDTPIMAHQFMACAEEAGFPPGVINLLTGADADLGDALVDHPRTRFINFTGSMKIGLRINERAAKVHTGQMWLKKAYLEMGGKDALIVDETVDLDDAANVATASAFGFQGQKCSAMSRLIVVEDVYDALLERLVQRASKLTIGPAEENPDMAAVINQKAVDKIMGYIEHGAREARLVLGGERADGPGYFIKPTIYADVDPGNPLACEEIFGPVVTVIRAKDFEQALEVANATHFGLTGGVMSQSRARLERARRDFQVGNLYLNRKITGALVGVQPFGGFNMSGSNAKAGGPGYLRLFMEMKTVTERF